MNKMDALTKALESSRFALEADKHTRERLVAIVESCDDAILSKDLNGIILSWNAGARRLFGYEAEEVLGKCVTILIPDDRQDEEPRILERIRRGERVLPYETVRRRKDGSLVDISLTISPIKDASGRVIGASKIARDISDRKRAEAALAKAAELQELLVAELSHRVKNTLATVVSIAEQSFSRDQPPEHACQAFRHRIRALGHTHGRLAEANWTGVFAFTYAECRQCHDSIAEPLWPEALEADILDPDDDDPYIVPGDPQASYFWRVLSEADRQPGDLKMPMTGTLPAEQIEFIEEWILAGAPL